MKDKYSKERRIWEKPLQKRFLNENRFPVKAGDLVIARIDMAMGQDGTTPLAIQSFEEMGGKKYSTHLV